jgi:hypothetical protein
MSNAADYAAAINRAAITLVAMSFKPELQPALLKEIAASVGLRGGLVDGQWLIKFDLRAVSDEIVERALAILSAALRERLPGIADEMDEAFGNNLRTLLGSIVRPLPTV